MVLDRQHVAGKSGGRVARRLLKLLLEPAADVLSLRGRVKRLLVRFLELRFELRDAVMLRDLGRAVGRLLAELLGVFVKLLFVLGCFHHAINLVSAFAVKSTMGTTRA